jgi:hypothetical protein
MILFTQIKAMFSRKRKGVFPMHKLMTAIIVSFLLMTTSVVGFAGERSATDHLYAIADRMVELVEEGKDNTCPKSGMDQMLCDLEFLNLKQKARSIGNYVAMAGVAGLSKNGKLVEELMEKAQKANREIPGEFKSLVLKWKKHTK